jgi:putative peptidoglycan lipid II flippase
LFTVGGLTGVSRILGFVRDILIAAVIGTGPVADAFFVAFRFPNFFRRLFAEGAFNAAFVPLFAGRLEADGHAAARAYAESVLSVLLAALAALTLASVLAMPWLMHVLAPGFADEPAKFDLAIQLTQLTFPYLLFMALVALYGGILNSLYKFAAFAAAPILLNVFFIVALVAVIPLGAAPGPALAWTVSLAGIGQFLALVFAARRAGITLWLPRPRLTPGVRRTLRLMGPGVLSAGALQLNLVVGTIIASWQAGAVSYLYYADRVYQLPLGLIGIAFGVVLLPDLSRKLRAGADGAAMESLNRGLELAMLLSLPAAVALAVIPQPIVTVLFERGAFDAEAARATAWALAAFALGVPAYVLVKILQPAFYAREDTVRPFKAAAAGVVVNIALSLALFVVMGHVGIALATAAAAWVNCGLLALWLRRAGYLHLDARSRRRLPRSALASALMGAALVLAHRGWLESWLDAGSAWAIPALALLVLGGAGVFGAAALILGAAAPSDFTRLRRRPAA